jgi:hypothetical protein
MEPVLDSSPVRTRDHVFVLFNERTDLTTDGHSPSTEGDSSGNLHTDCPISSTYTQKQQPTSLIHL